MGHGRGSDGNVALFLPVLDCQLHGAMATQLIGVLVILRHRNLRASLPFTPPTLIQGIIPTMLYYEVRIASLRYHKPVPLTYAADATLYPGVVVAVPLQAEQALGVIVRRVRKPSFSTKSVTRVVPGAKVPSALLQLANWLQDYYPAPSGAIMQLLLPSALLPTARATTGTPQSATPQSIRPADLPPLTTEQSAVVTRFTSMAHTSALLHGDTGTGKTRVYLDLAREQLQRGQSVIVLTPEISLTPQLEHTVSAAFPGQTIVMHSHLTQAERRTVWLHAAAASSTKPVIVLGARSALFAPLHSVGLIVVDEMHDQAYKQEQAPHYQTTRVAAKLAALHHAKLLLGSATPSVNDFYTFEHKDLPVLRMVSPAITQTHNNTVHLVDLRSKQMFSRSPWLSDDLLNAIRSALESKQQSLVFLNRRGTARLVLCQDCGWQALCSHCDLPLTYHGDSHRMQCHTCGFAATPPTMCQSCQSANIIFRGIGTKSLTAEIERLFPHARVQRFDSDNTKAQRFDQQFAAVKSGAVDILVGTQQLSKGLDLPRLGVVGVILADTGLYFPDYTAEERTYQMITQVIGRVGRGHGSSTIIVQTYQPDSPVIRAALAKDYASFYTAQVAERKLFRFPPFCYVLKLRCSRATAAGAERAATTFAKKLADLRIPAEVIGPAPAFAEKTRGHYTWQLVIKARQRPTLTTIIQALPANWNYDIDPSNLL